MFTIVNAHSEQLDIGSVPSLSSAGAGHWLHVVSHLDPKFGGLSTVVPQLCASLVQAGRAKIGLAAFCRPGEMPPRALRTYSTTFWPTERSQWWRDRDLQRRFRFELSEADGVHIHGLWEQSTYLAARMARALGKPYTISAHGMLDTWALRNKRWKKGPYALFVERGNLRRATCLHALTRAEADDYRRFGSRSPIAIIPNGVHVPEALEGGLFLSRFPVVAGKRIVLFLGRIHFKKGLDLLIDSWKQVSRTRPEAHLVLAGPDSEGTRSELEQRIRNYGIGDRITFTGMLDESMKWSALAAAECFVLPSYSEGLSTSVLEAMAAGLPVVVTEQCNMPEIAAHSAGWIIPSRTDDLSGALTQCLGYPTYTNRATGLKGRQLIQERYSWSSVAARMTEVYEWIGGGKPPQSVELLVS